MNAFAEQQPTFSEAEKAYLAEQRLARVATVSAKGEVDVSPIGLHFDGERFLLMGMDLPSTFRWKNVQANPSVSLVVDDLASVEPWRPRGIKVHGRGEIGKTHGGRAAIFVIPDRKWSWGIEPRPSA
ncbi:MAG: pyridoxamine 5-phosphate oxidase family protein [Chloroflexota bacterium]|jgi:pyridoxamine 5'-phosphate oxidase family protein|nr:pyridoxamine 5-phosphate oxidase family protein [Chloroflexota bacterium]